MKCTVKELSAHIQETSNLFKGGCQEGLVEMMSKLKSKASRILPELICSTNFVNAVPCLAFFFLLKSLVNAILLIFWGPDPMSSHITFLHTSSPSPVWNKLFLQLGFYFHFKDTYSIQHSFLNLLIHQFTNVCETSGGGVSVLSKRDRVPSFPEEESAISCSVKTAHMKRERNHRHFGGSGKT